METKHPGLIRTTCDPVVKVFDNGSAVLLRPEVPDWIRTSEVGVWIFDLLRTKPRGEDQLISETMARYELPDEAVRTPVEQFLKALLDQGYAEVEAPAAGEEGVADAAQQRSRGRPAPPRLEDLTLRQLWLHITSRCNLRCGYCYYPVEHPGRELTLDCARSLFGQAAACGVDQIILSGGEPMLHSQVLDLVKSCREAASWNIKLVSNGTMPEGDVFDRVTELIDDLQVSIDGADEATHDAVRGKGSFARAARAFVRLHETGSKVCRGISFTPTPDNVAQIPQLNKLGYQLCADYLHLNHPKLPSDPSRRSELEARGFLSQEFRRQAIAGFRRLYINLISDRKDVRGMTYRPLHLDASFGNTTSLIHILRLDNCGAGITTLGVDAGGEVYPCASLTGWQSCRLGTFPYQSLEELSRAGRAWNRAVFSVERDPKCAECLYRYFCGGGCRILSPSLSQRDASCSVLIQCYEEFFKYASVPENQRLIELAQEQSARGWDHVKTNRCA